MAEWWRMAERWRMAEKWRMAEWWRMAGTYVVKWCHGLQVIRWEVHG